MSDPVTVELDGGVAVITLNRPERLNAFTGEMGAALGRAYERCDRDDAVRAVVLTGSGRAFCAGADMRRGDATFAASGANFSASPVRPTAFEIRKPVIAAINGHALGIGLSLSMQCDVRFIAEGGTYGFVHVRRGMMPDAHAHWTVTRLCGVAVANDLFLSGRSFDAGEAVSMGLASNSFPADEVLAHTISYARDIERSASPLAVAFSKRLLWHSPSLDAEMTERLETELHRHLMAHPDAVEGPRAFVEKRDPVWTSRLASDWPTDLS